MPDDAADVVQCEFRKTRIAVAGEQVAAVLEQGLVNVHARTIVADERLGHEGGGLAPGMRDVVHTVLEDLHLIGLADQRIEGHADLALPGGGHLMVVHLGAQPHRLHGRAHRHAQVVQRIDRRNGEITPLHPRAVAGIVAAGGVLRDPGALAGMDREPGCLHVGLPVHGVEDEELRLRAEAGSVRNPGRTQIILGAACDRTGIAAVALHRGRFEHIAAHDDHRLFREWIGDGGLVVGHQHHVGGFDALPAMDGRAIEHLSVLEGAGIDGVTGKTDVLLLAQRIGEAQIDPACAGFSDQ